MSCPPSASSSRKRASSGKCQPGCGTWPLEIYRGAGGQGRFQQHWQQCATKRWLCRRLRLKRRFCLWLRWFKFCMMLQAAQGGLHQTNFGFSRVRSFKTCRTWDSFIKSTPSSTVNRLLLRPACFVAAQRLDCGLQQSSQTHVGPKRSGRPTQSSKSLRPKVLPRSSGPRPRQQRLWSLPHSYLSGRTSLNCPRISEFRERVKLSSLIEEFAHAAELVSLRLGVWAAVRTARLDAPFPLPS